MADLSDVCYSDLSSPDREAVETLLPGIRRSTVRYSVPHITLAPGAGKRPRHPASESRVRCSFSDGVSDQVHQTTVGSQTTLQKHEELEFDYRVELQQLIDVYSIIAANSHHSFKERGFIGLKWGRSTKTDLEAVETDSAVPSIESDRTVGRHTAVPHQTDELPQSVSGAPAPGTSVPTAAKKRKRDESDEPEEKDKKRFKSRRGSCVSIFINPPDKDEMFPSKDTDKLVILHLTAS
ncbi:hypothetical protein DPX16_0476 [Anabarilius grahami]|uniref:Uncharacterized protein n=1 Tax=Anabarilius grahami TaxID=495550 RepID=A0A3N0Z1I8_ANAGA|nr:hypothetical protein DPX16_0476 [Anabarilius grahami]